MQFADGAVLAEVDGAVGWLTLNRPARRNAVSLAMWRALPDAVAALSRAPSVRAIVVRGAGEEAFASGADIDEFDQVRADAALNRVFTEHVSAATAALMDAPLPAVAMIHGFCMGGGVVLATACDIRMCDDAAQFGVPAAKLGLGYELDNLTRLARLVGDGTAMLMVASARRLSAAEALAAGLVQRVCAADALEDAVRALCGEIAANAPLPIAAAKRCLAAAHGRIPKEEAQAAIDACFNSADFGEGRAAFRERRPPAFRGV
jgi:enoyl-CoA hydratase/carnithine racemase